MNSIYRALSTSKQNFHQRLNGFLVREEEQQQLLPVLIQLRNDHPKMSVRKMYYMLNPKNMGRDLFEQFCFRYDLKVQTTKSFRRTTNSNGVIRFADLVSGRELTAVNQVWVSDITYYRIADYFYYITFVMDLYSRFIVGYHCSKSLRTIHSTLPALKMGIRTAGEKLKGGLIFHSDGGGQYYSKAFTGHTKKYKMLNSMAETVYENPHAERVNGIIKNEYLRAYDPSSFKELKSELKRSVYKYNYQRPHNSLKRKTPSQLYFNSKIVNIPQWQSFTTLQQIQN